MREFFQKYPLLRNRYILILVAFLIWMTFLDQNNFFNQYKMTKELQRMKEKEAYLDSETVKNQQKVEELSKSKQALEKYARERYWMKKENEDLFIILEDSVNRKDTIQ